jgi:hypothetical protein
VRERERDGSDPLERLEDAVRATLPQPLPGTWVVIVERCPATAPCGGLVIELAVHGDTVANQRWLGGLRAATRNELVAAEPARIVLATASRQARFVTLANACPNPRAALDLDDPERVIPPGEPFKCTDR